MHMLALVSTDALLLHSELSNSWHDMAQICWVCRCRAVRQLFSIFAGSFVGET